MFEYLKGIVTVVAPGYLVVESKDGVGYRLNPANPYAYNEGQEVQVFIEQVVRENEVSLYGFTTAAEKALFNKLTSVSGIGPKSALAILAGADAGSLAQAVANDDVDYLTQFPGVGKKTAQQIVLDLKGKLDDWQTMAGGTTLPLDDQAGPQQAQQLEDALAALAALGYSNKDIAKVKKHLAKESGSTEDLISQALKLLVS
ncbi:Holliday junction branch migration protein RuvA [Leuconostocaceae bacterium ESL0958]|nr:Holliday junction branch migration protein RuvA [Leuconostocaceae bacterium ESL0958]